jgi:hypothetical protein
MSPPGSPLTPAFSPTYYGSGDGSPVHETSTAVSQKYTDEVEVEVDDDSPDITAEIEAESKRKLQAMLDELRTIHTLPRVFEILPDDFIGTTKTQTATQLDTTQMKGHEVKLPQQSANTTTVVMPPAFFPQGSVDCNGEFHEIHTHDPQERAL